MGLLDSLLNDDSNRTALGLLAAAGPSATPQSFGQRLMGGLLQSQEIGDRQKQAAQIEEMRKMQLAQHAMALRQAQQAEEQANRDRAWMQTSNTPIGGIEANAASGIAGPRPEALSVVGQLPKFDPRAALSQGVSPQAIVQMQQLIAKEQAKIKEYREVRNPDGSVTVVGFDEYGKPVQTGQTPFKAEEVRDFGGFVGGIDPITGKARRIGDKTMTPGEVASNGLARERLNFDKASADRAVTWQQDADGNYVALPTKLNGAGPVRGVAAIAPGSGMTPLQGKGAGMTEDQAKATGWLVQAENAFKNMKAVGFDKDGNPKSAAIPGFNDALEKTPYIGGAANYMRSADRQRFIQASSSFSEALLRAATGAGVNESEAAQKVKELTPQFGEDAATTRQKMAAGELYLESLRVRAGPGARKAAAISANAGLPSDIADLLNQYNPKGR